MTKIEALRTVQEKLGLNQQDFGTYIGVSEATINDWMRGAQEVPDYVPEMVSRIAEYDMKALDMDRIRHQGS